MRSNGPSSMREKCVPARALRCVALHLGGAAVTEPGTKHGRCVTGMTYVCNTRRWRRSCSPGDYNYCWTLKPPRTPKRVSRRMRPRTWRRRRAARSARLMSPGRIRTKRSEKRCARNRTHSCPRCALAVRVPFAHAASYCHPVIAQAKLNKKKNEMKKKHGGASTDAVSSAPAGEAPGDNQPPSKKQKRLVQDKGHLMSFLDSIGGALPSIPATPPPAHLPTPALKLLQTLNRFLSGREQTQRSRRLRRSLQKSRRVMTRSCS